LANRFDEGLVLVHDEAQIATDFLRDNLPQVEVEEETLEQSHILAFRLNRLFLALLVGREAVDHHDRHLDLSGSFCWAGCTSSLLKRPSFVLTTMKVPVMPWSVSR